MRKRTLFIQTSLFMVMLWGGICVAGSEMDNRIESTFKKTHVYRTYLADDHISISSKDGVVTLKGTVSDGTEKLLAESTAEALPGVTAVHNEIKITGEPPKEHSDAWLQTKVMGALLFHKNVSAVKTKVSAKDGVVLLTGEAKSAAEKELAGAYANDVEGVKDVRNEIIVNEPTEKTREAMSDKIDDASITAQVKMAMMAHRSTSAIRTKVDTKEGVVTLTGRAKNSAEKDLVTKLVEDIDGVVKVDNRMSVE